MRIHVQKYGGSSVADNDRIRRVAERIADTRRHGPAVVAVVSAMGGTTGRLAARAREISQSPGARELDMLLSTGEKVSSALVTMALQDLDVDAVALTGAQAGIVTDDAHTNADVRAVRTDRIRRELADGRVVVVAGYQGVNADGDVTTLGRGGSDVTAVTLAAALEAERCEICSDVDGVYTADPRVVPDARPMRHISWHGMAELSRCCAGVLDPRAVRAAQRQRVTVQALSTFDPDAPGTTVGGDDDDAPVLGLAARDGLVRLRSDGAGRVLLDDLPDGGEAVARGPVDPPAVDALICGRNAVDMDAFARNLRERAGGRVDLDTDVAAVSAVGPDLGDDDDAIAAVHHVLDEADVAVHDVWSGDQAITALVSDDDRDVALRSLHEALIEAAEPVGSRT